MLCPPSQFSPSTPSMGTSVMNYSLLPLLPNEAPLCLQHASTSSSWHFPHCGSREGVSDLTPRVGGIPSPGARAAPRSQASAPLMRGPPKFRSAVVFQAMGSFLHQGAQDRLILRKLLPESRQLGVSLWTILCSSITD